MGSSEDINIAEIRVHSRLRSIPQALLSIIIKPVGMLLLTIYILYLDPVVDLFRKGNKIQKKRKRIKIDPRRKELIKEELKRRQNILQLLMHSKHRTRWFFPQIRKGDFLLTVMGLPDHKEPKYRRNPATLNFYSFNTTVKFEPVKRGNKNPVYILRIENKKKQNRSLLGNIGTNRKIKVPYNKEKKTVVKTFNTYASFKRELNLVKAMKRNKESNFSPKMLANIQRKKLGQKCGMIIYDYIEGEDLLTTISKHNQIIAHSTDTNEKIAANRRKEADIELSVTYLVHFQHEFNKGFEKLFPVNQKPEDYDTYINNAFASSFAGNKKLKNALKGLFAPLAKQNMVFGKDFNPSNLVGTELFRIDFEAGQYATEFLDLSLLLEFRGIYLTEKQKAKFLEEFINQKYRRALGKKDVIDYKYASLFTQLKGIGYCIRKLSTIRNKKMKNNFIFFINAYYENVINLIKELSRLCPEEKQKLNRFKKIFMQKMGKYVNDERKERSEESKIHKRITKFMTKYEQGAESYYY
jgi:hypothetical protein